MGRGRAGEGDGATGLVRPLASMTLDQAVDTFRNAAAQRGIPAARIRSVVSYVRSSLLDGPAGSDRSVPDVLPLLGGLRELAHRVGRGRGESGSALRSRTSNVALFTRVLGEALGIGEEGMLWAGVPEPWLPLVRRVRSRSAQVALREFIALAQAQGVASPAELPPVASITQWGGGDGETDEVIQRGLAAYRQARRARGHGALPSRPPSRTFEYGIQSVPFLLPLLAAAHERRPGSVPDPARLLAEGGPRARDLIGQLAPLMARALEAFEARRLAAHGSADYLLSAERAVSRSVASLARLLVAEGAGMAEVAEALETLSLTHLWTHRRTVQDADGGSVDAAPVDPGDPDLDGLQPEAGVQTAPLLRALADEMASRSYRASPLMVSAHAERLPVPLYTPAVVQAVRRLFAIARDAVMPKLVAAGEAGQHRWRTIEFEQRAILAHMTAVARRRRAAGQVDKRLLPLHWGELVCRGVPALREQALEAEAHWAARLASGLAADSERGARVEGAWHRALTTYLVVAVFAAEGLREKNLRGARLGAQVLPEWRRDRRGRIVGLDRVTTRFRGDDPSWVRLKQTHDSGGGSSPRTRVREWQWAPGIVDHRLLFRYLTEVRPALARQAGLLGDGETLDPARDTLALFLSPRPRRSRRGEFAGGSYSRGILSDIVGRALFWMTRDLLGRPGMPASYKEACGRTHPLRGLFGAHVIRSLGATWWGGLRNRWDYAEAYTNDLQPTLHAHYAKIPTWMARAVGTGGPGDPTWWNAVADVMVTEMDSGLDWDGFWREFTPEREWRAHEVRARLRRPAGEGSGSPDAAQAGRGPGGGAADGVVERDARRRGRSPSRRAG